MTASELSKAIQILGGADILRQAGAGAGSPRKPAREGKGRAPGKRSRERKPKLSGEKKRERIVEVDERAQWTPLIRAGLPSAAIENAARHLGVSLNELSRSLRLPARTIHRRVETGSALTPEETERSVRVARALAKAQELLGEENGKAWLLTSCRGLGGVIPLTLLDTADGFAAVVDELGRLEYGVLS